MPHPSIPSLRHRPSLLVTLLCLACQAHALDAVVVTTRFTRDKPLSIHMPQYGNLVRHEIRDSKVVGATVIYDKGDAGMATLSPSGARVAFLRKDGAVMVLPIAGGEATKVAELQHFNETPLPSQAICPIYWPLGKDESWLYFRDQPSELDRVQLTTGVREVAVKFNRVIEMDLSRYADTGQGLVVGRPDESMVVIYDLSRGTGDLYRDVATFNEEGACGLSISPEGTLIAANNGGHSKCRLIDPNGNKVGEFVLNQWAPVEQRPERMWQLFRWSNHPDWLMVTQGGGGSGQEMDFTNAVLLNYKSGQQIRVTDNRKGTFDYAGRCHDLNQPTLLQLGLQSGEAPYTTTFSVGDDKDGWQWDYGDGTKGAAPQHTYATAGSFAVVARKGDQTQRGTVAVRPRRAPRGTALMVDTTHLQVSFDEAITIADGARWTTGAGVPSTALRVSPDRRSVLVTLAEGVTGAETLTLRGLTDTAQQPNAPEPAILPVAYRCWPVTLDSAVFVWLADAPGNLLWNEEGTQIVPALVERTGLAQYSRDGAMVTAGGHFFPLKPGWDPDRRLMLQGRKELALTLEFLFAPAAISQSNKGMEGRWKDMPPMIYSWAWGTKQGFFLAQEGDRLYFSPVSAITWNTAFTDPIPIGTITDLSLQHLLITQRAGELAIYRNGERVVHRTDIPGKPGFHGCPTYFGYNGWRGRIDAVGVYTRFTTPESAQASYHALQQVLAARKSVEQLEVEVKLLAASKVPDPKAILPYHSALVVNEWQVVKVVRGAYKPQRIRVAQWAILADGLTPVAALKPGATARLKLERFTDTPKLEREFLNDTLPDDFDLTLYVEAN
jgi:hypothetical protein